MKFEKPDRSDYQPNFTKTPENDMLDVSWYEDFLSDGRPYRAEMWVQDHVCSLTVFFSSLNLNYMSNTQFADMLVRENLLVFMSEERYVRAEPVTDASGNHLLSVNIVMADDESTFAAPIIQMHHYDIQMRHNSLEADDSVKLGESANLIGQKLFKTIEFATKAHSGDFWKNTRLPYIIHPLGVAKILIESGCSEEVVLAGLLHDTVEDTEVTLGQIENEFGKEVARLVEGASEPDKSDTWEDRKKHTIDYLKDAPMNVVQVTFADKLDNMRAIRSDYEKIGNKVFRRFNEPKNKQRWYFESLAQVFSKRIVDEPLVTLLREFKSEIAKVFGKT